MIYDFRFSSAQVQVKNRMSGWDEVGELMGSFKFFKVYTLVPPAGFSAPVPQTVGKDSSALVVFLNYV